MKRDRKLPVILTREEVNFRMVLPFVLILSLVTNGIVYGLAQPSNIYVAEASSAAASPVRTGATSIVLKNGGIEIDGLSYTDAEFKTLLDSAEIIRIPFDAEVGEGMVEQLQYDLEVLMVAQRLKLEIRMGGE